MKDSKENCIFCKIIAGVYDCSEIYRDDKVMAFLDINPVNPGHSLVIPLDHSSSISGLSSEVVGHMFKIGQKLVKTIKESEVQAEGINLILSDGEKAGQEVLHSHLHIIPRFTNDGVTLGLFKQRVPIPTREELENIVEMIKKSLSS